MRIIRYIDAQDGTVRLAAVTDGEQAFPLRSPDFIALVREADAAGITPLEVVRRQIEGADPLPGDWRSLSLLTPVDAPEVWAAGVTYERSREARNEESKGTATGDETFYDKVYRAERPEIFFKSSSARTARPGTPVCVRSDSQWQVPEPELGIVLDRRGRILGYHVSDWLVPTTNLLAGRGMMGEGAIDLPRLRELVDAAGYDGPIEAEVINPDLAAIPGPELIARTRDAYLAHA